MDDFQDISTGALPVLQECLSHAREPRTILTGTPKSVDNHLEAAFSRSTANAWMVPCPGCGRGVVFDEYTVAADGPFCPGC